jgi:hypothetical protein
MLNPLAGAYAKRRFQTLRHGVKSASGMLTRSVCKPAGGRGAYVKPAGGRGAYVKPAGGRGAYVKPAGGRGAYLNPLTGAYAKRRFQTLRHGAKSASGMLTRSVCKPAGGRGAYVPPWQMVDEGGR